MGSGGRLCAILLHMRMHISLDDKIVAEIDAIAGPRRRSAFIREVVLDALDRRRRIRLLRQAGGSLENSEHDWDDDPAGWVRHQRWADPRRVG